MTNLPIASNNSQHSANVTSTAQKNDATNVQPASPFGAVLARQMDGANAPASNTPSSATGVDTKKVTDSAASAGKSEQDKVPATPNIPGDPSSALAVMLQLPQEIKTPAASLDLKTGKAEANQLAGNIGVSQTNASIDLVTTAPGKSDAAVMVADGAAAGDIKPNNGKTWANQLAGNIGASQANASIDLTTAASGKSDVPILTTDRPVLHSGSGLEITKSAELPNGLPSATQSALNPVLSAASMTASGMMSGVLTRNKAADSPQTISSHFGSSGWPDEFSQKVSWMGTQKNQVAELQLNPPDLGPLNVVLKISDNQATALFTSPHSTVREAVENAMPKLREILANNGITLGNTMVSDQSSRDRSAEGFMNQGSGTAAQRGGFSDPPESTGLSPAITQVLPIRRHNWMVDTFA